MDILDKAKGSMGAIEKVLAGVPGIKGYKEKELRRETDKAVRQTVAKLLEDQKSRLDGVQEEALGSGMLGILDDIEKVGRKLQLLIDRIRTASYGYAPLFDLVKVKETQLDALIQFDEALVSGVERIKTIIDNMAALPGRTEAEWKESIRALGNAVDTLNTEFSHRDEVIMQATEVPEED